MKTSRLECAMSELFLFYTSSQYCSNDILIRLEGFSCQFLLHAVFIHETKFSLNFLSTLLTRLHRQIVDFCLFFRQILLLDTKRSMNVNIFLKQFKCSHREIISMIEAGDVNIIGPERLRGLQKILPETDEVISLFNQ